MTNLFKAKKKQGKKKKTRRQGKQGEVPKAENKFPALFFSSRKKFIQMKKSRQSESRRRSNQASEVIRQVKFGVMKESGMR